MNGLTEFERVIIFNVLVFYKYLNQNLIYY